MLKVFTSLESVPKPGEHVHFLAPFFGIDGEYHGWGPQAGSVDRWCAIGPSLVKLVSDPSEADVAVLPGDWGRYGLPGAKSPELARRFLDVCRTHRLRTLVFYFNDSDRPLPLEDVLVFRTSLNRSAQLPFEFALPAWNHDMQERYVSMGPWLRGKSPRPVVGFCGFLHGVPGSGTGGVRHWAKVIRKRMRAMGVEAGLLRHDGAVRMAAIKRLSVAAGIQTNFLVRGDFMGDAARSAEESRAQYVANMHSCDYALCARGVGNYSWRLFEAMSCGRIPLLIDTDSPLPVPGAIDWRSLSVIVPASRLDKIEEMVVSHFDSLTEAGYLDLQRAIRRAWVEHLSVEGFFRCLVAWLEQGAPKGGGGRGPFG